VCRISGAASIETQGVLAQLLVREVHDCKKVMGENAACEPLSSQLFMQRSVYSKTLEFGLE
jgi:hypothetical protein